MYQKRRVRVIDTYICYIDTRAGEETVIFLHGSPSYSFTWRNIIPRVDGFARCLAPDLVGMGDSARDPTDSYTFDRQFEYLNEWIKSIYNLPNQFIIVGHDWGVALGAKWARLNPERVKAFVHMEGIVAPFDSWDDLHLDPTTRDLYTKLVDGTEKETETLALETDVICDVTMANITLQRKLSKYEDEGLRRPSLHPGEARKSALALIRQLPIRGSGPDNAIQMAESICTFMENSDTLPKLFISAEPGQYSAWLRKKMEKWPQQEIAVVNGNHFPQEDDPELVGNAIAKFVKKFAQFGFGSRYQ